MRDESRSDWSNGGSKDPPIMGTRQTLASYIEDVRNWVLCTDSSAEKWGPLVLTRGLSRCPRLQDIGKKFDVRELVATEGAFNLLKLVADETGVTDISVKMRRFADLVALRRGNGDLEQFLEKFEARLRQVNAEGLCMASSTFAGLFLLISVELSQQDLNNLMTLVNVQEAIDNNGDLLGKVTEALKRVVAQRPGWRQLPGENYAADARDSTAHWTQRDASTDWRRAEANGGNGTRTNMATGRTRLTTNTTTNL